VLNRRDALLGVLFSSAAASSAATLLAPAEAFAETAGNGQPPFHVFLAWLSNGVYTATYYSVNFVRFQEVQEGFTAYEDEANKFTIVVPQGD
jgi:hypothetical protein